MDLKNPEAAATKLVDDLKKEADYAIESLKHSAARITREVQAFADAVKSPDLEAFLKADHVLVGLIGPTGWANEDPRVMLRVGHRSDIVLGEVELNKDKPHRVVLMIFEGK